MTHRCAKGAQRGCMLGRASTTTGPCSPGEIDERNDTREQDRAALRDELRTIQQQIEQLQDFIRRGVEKVKETVKGGLVHGPQPDRANTSAEPTKPAQEPQGGRDPADDGWMPGRSLLD